MRTDGHKDETKRQAIESQLNRFWILKSYFLQSVISGIGQRHITCERYALKLIKLKNSRLSSYWERDILLQQSSKEHVRSVPLRSSTACPWAVPIPITVQSVSHSSCAASPIHLICLSYITGCHYINYHVPLNACLSQANIYRPRCQSLTSDGLSN